jgi:hypothetical protein
LRAHDPQNLLQAIDDQQVALPWALVQASPRNPLGLEPSVGDRHVAIVITVPDIHWHGDVFQAEAPITGEQGKILCRS